VDLLDGAASARCGFGGGECHGLVLVEARRRAADAAVAEAQRLARAAGTSPEMLDGDALDAAWRGWVDLARVDDLGPGEALLGVPALPAEGWDALRAVTRAVETAGVHAAVWYRAGNGTTYARLRAEDDPPAALASVQAALLARWPATTLTAGSPEVARSAQVWGTPPATLPLLRALKGRFDPGAVLNPGRFVGGL
jgi:glycolate oxidase FAD binding subunit